MSYSCDTRVRVGTNAGYLAERWLDCGVLTVSRTGAELLDLVPDASARRVFLGISGAPGAGKSTLATFLVQRLLERGERAVAVPMDGFHLADVELQRLGLLDRKGGPETFDPHGYAALLGRLAARPDHTVYAPGFDRELEQPLAGAVPVPPDVDVVVTEGNYLLLDRPEWQAVRIHLDAVWHAATPGRVRLERLVARHVAFGKDPAAARAWVARVDQPNARMVDQVAARADRLLDLSEWKPGRPPRSRP
jgi:pantothenate kinase